MHVLKFFNIVRQEVVNHFSIMMRGSDDGTGAVVVNCFWHVECKMLNHSMAHLRHSDVRYNSEV